MPDIRVIVNNAWKAGIAIPAFNVPYLPMIEPVVRAVVDQNSFAMIETARLEWFKFESGGPKLVAEEFARWQNPDHVRLHLDHVPVMDGEGKRLDYLADIRLAIELGFHSVMVDGSLCSLNENIAATRQVVELAHEAKISCEAELGVIHGHEVGTQFSYDDLFASGMGFTQVKEARRFVAESGCDWLSVAVGSIHGAVLDGLKDRKKIPARIDLDHLQNLAHAASIPLVLHGGSGIPKDLVLASFKKGIAKINIGTEIRQVYESALRSKTQVSFAQDAVYNHTAWLIGEYFELSGIQAIVMQEAS